MSRKARQSRLHDFVLLIDHNALGTEIKRSPIAQSHPMRLDVAPIARHRMILADVTRAIHGDLARVEIEK